MGHRKKMFEFAKGALAICQPSITYQLYIYVLFAKKWDAHHSTGGT